MRVKKFEAKTMKDALKMVKNELGPDAVILSARDNSKSFGLGGEPSVEITAAVSESTLQKKQFAESRLRQGDREIFQGADAKTQRKIIETMIEKRARNAAPMPKAEKRPITRVSYIDIPDEVEANLRRKVGRSPAPPSAGVYGRGPARPTVAEAPQVRGPREAEAVMSETARARIRMAAREAANAPSMELFEEPAARPVRAARPGVGGLEMVRPPERGEGKEISVLKGEIERLNKVLEGFSKVPRSFVTMHPGAEFGLNFDVSFMFQKLCDAGVSPENSMEILLAAQKSIDPLQLKKRPIIDAWVARWLLEKTQVVKDPFQGRLHLFVGGAGGGKTTTLVKMASQLVVKEKKKVAVLSTDAFKVGAVDQLKIYCQILNVPFAVIRSRADWEWILGQLTNVDAILVDFPGLQLQELEDIQLLRSLMPPAEAQPTTHYCLSVTSKDSDALEMARRYKTADPQDVIFTCLDQSVQHGLIYNLQKKINLPLHSFGIGSRIPEDFEAASPERVLDLIFKLTKLRRELK